MRLLQFCAFLCATFPAAVAADRTMTCAHCAGAQDVNEIATAVRSAMEIRELSTDPAAKSVAFRGTPDQVAAAEWIFRNMDRPPADANAQADSSKLEYRVGSNDVLRVFLFPNAPSVQDLQELATGIRSIVEFRRLFTYNSPRAIVARGTDEQIAVAEWLHSVVSPGGRPSPDRIRMTTGETVRVLYLPDSPTIQDLQEMATVIRSISEIRRVFTNNRLRAILIRAPDEEWKMADWIHREFTRAANQPPAGELQLANGEVIRAFYLRNTDTIAAFQKSAAAVRTRAGIRRMFTYNRSRAVFVRDTADRVAEAARLFKGES